MGRARLCAVVVFAAFSSAHAMTYYVAPGGNDAAAGTSPAPFASIQRAADLVNAGDTVIVRDGTYTDSVGNFVVVYIRRGGNSAAWVTFKSENPWGAKIRGDAEHGFFVSADYVRIEGFDISVSHGIEACDAVGGYNSHVQLVGNHLHNIGRVCTDTAYGIDAIFIGNGVDWVIERNVIHDIGRLSAGENGCNPGNAYYRNHDHGIYVVANDITIRNNVFYRMEHGWSLHLYPNALSNIQILNNTFALPNPYNVGQIIVATSMTNSRISNNIFYQPNTSAINYFGGITLTNVEVTNNLVYPGTLGTSTPAGVTSTGNITQADPLFVNAGAFDFHLQSMSPAINAGVAASLVPDDFDGVMRPQGAGLDIGAFERMTVVPPDTTAPKAPTGLVAQ